MTRPTTMRIPMVAVLALALIVGARGEVGAKCARVYNAPEVLTHGADAIPGGGGVLVGWTSSTTHRDDYDDNADPANHPSWRFVVGKKRVIPVIEQLAPGLAVYRPGPIKGRKAAKLTLKDGATRIGAFSAQRKRRAFTAAAPTLSSVTQVTTQGGRWGDQISVDVALSAAPPADAAALVLYRVDPGVNTPIAWASVKGVTSTAVTIYRSEGRCGSNPTGLTHPGVGTEVVLAWVDPFGRRSPVSAAVTVK